MVSSRRPASTSRFSRATTPSRSWASRPLVGSSAISSRLSPAWAMAIATRWPMPPEIWNG
jgi:hypothetical protein